MGLVIKDVDPASWHHYACIVMLTAAMVLQLASTDGGILVRISWRTLASALFVAGLIFLKRLEIPYYRLVRGNQITERSNSLILRKVKDHRRSLEQVKARMDRRKVVAIYGNTAIDWVHGYRFSFFPRGVAMSPKGIADYVVVDKNLPRKKPTGYFNIMGDVEFEPILQTSFHVLCQRKSIEPKEAKSRDNLVEVFGAGAIGGVQKYPLTPPYSIPEIPGNPL